MKITPADILNQKFGITFRGYDKQEVDAFLDVIAKDLEDLLRENSYLKEEIERINTELTRLKEMEETIKETIISAQKMAESFREQAKLESENILNAARLQAEKICFDAAKQASETKTEILKHQARLIEIKEIVKSIFEGFLENLDRVIKSYEK
ncbi:MAG: DivIVA domain-containing protein [Proteobacteria bacterium]|nr:DivIVA domain-containing protein [Pseudomonadota bacterium]